MKYWSNSEGFIFVILPSASFQTWFMLHQESAGVQMDAQYLALLVGGCMLGSKTLYWSMIFSTNFCFSRRSSLSFSLGKKKSTNTEHHNRVAELKMKRMRREWAARSAERVPSIHYQGEREWLFSCKCAFSPHVQKPRRRKESCCTHWTGIFKKNKRKTAAGRWWFLISSWLSREKQKR